MKSIRSGRPPLSPPHLSAGDLSQPLRAALTQLRVVRVEVAGELPHWLAAGARQKRAMIARGAPAARVWTVRELEGFPWCATPVTLGTCVAGFQSSAPEELVG